MVKVLLIPSSDYLGHPFPQRHNHIFERLHGRGVEVHVARFVLYRSPKLETRCIIHNVDDSPPAHGLAYYYLTSAPRHAKRLLKVVLTEGIELIVAGNLLPPKLLKDILRLVSPKVPMIFDLQDYYPMSAAGYVGKPGSVASTLALGIFEMITRDLIRSSSAVVTPGTALEIYARSMGARTTRIVPNGIGEVFLTEHNGREVREALGFSDDEIVVGYLGSVEFWLDMEPLIAAVSKVRSLGVPVRLLIIGGGLRTGYSVKVKRLLMKYRVQDVTTWLGFIRYEDVPKYMAAMDVGTIPFDVSNLTAYYAAPNKLWEYLSQGAEVISSPIPEAVYYRRYVYIAETPDEWASAILRIYKGERRARSRMDEIKKLIRERTWVRSASLYRRVIEEVLQSAA